MNPKEVLIVVRLWDQCKFTLSDRHELVVQKNDSAYDLARRVATLFPHLLAENVEACRIVALYKFSR